MSPEKSSRNRNQPAAKKNTRKTARRKPYGEKHIIGFLFGICLLLTGFLAALLGSMVALKIPDIRTVSHYRPLQTSYLLDRRGEVLEKIFKENRTVVSLAAMPDLLPKAFVAAEDGRFYDHPGLDFFSVLRAAFVNIKRGGRAHGGSTITQQVARSLLLSREKTYLRKIKEAILAWRIDSLLSKDEILYIYLNQIYLGGGAHGVEAASQVFFNKHVDQLTLGEMTVLAGLPQAPSRYSPRKNPELAKKRQRYVLNRMAADGYINSTEAQKAYEAGIEVAENKHLANLDAGYYAEIVKKRARRLVGVSRFNSGIKIYTHLDSKMQEIAVQSVRSGVMASFGRQARLGKVKRKVPQGALVSLEGCTAKVRAMVGGTDFTTTRYNRAAIARRQAGSSFKPIVYSAALGKGWTSTSQILDAPLAITGGDNTMWRPKNYTGKYYGEVTLQDALANSYNTAAVRLLQKIGLNSVHNLSANMGITSEMPGDLSLALGSVDVSLLEMSAAYSAFICEGKYTAPLFIEKIAEGDGTLLLRNRALPKQVISAKVAAEMRDMLEQVITKGTGERAQGLTGKSGGKTGTTDDNRDAWFIGFNRGNITGVWVGYDKNATLGEGENGGRTAAPIWLDFMQKSSSLR